MLGIVLINYNSENDIIHYIRNELSKINYTYKIVIVNNSASRKSNNFFKNEAGICVTDVQNIKKDSNIFLLSANTNLGYAKANNLGATFLIDHFNVDYVLFTNSDIVFNDRDVVESLISKAETDDKIGGIGPKIVGSNGIDQPPIMFISPLKYLAKYILKPIIKKILKNGQRTSNNTLNTNNPYPEGYYYAVSGCFMLVKTHVFLSVGRFDPETFLYSEERILSERMNKTGSKFYYYPEFSIIHHENTTTLKSFKIPELKSFLFDSEYYYYTKYIISNPLVLLIFRFIKYYRK